MEMEVPISKHVCKFCSRRFACGRALGGHMRIHGSASASALASEFNGREGEDYQFGVKRRRVGDPQPKKQKEEDEEAEEEEASCDNGLNKNSNPMYDLRRNRRRSWRYTDVDYSFMVPATAAEADELGSKFVKDFQICEECGEEFTSSTALIAHIRCHHNMKAEEQEEEEDEEGNETDDLKEEGKFFYWDSESDTETVRAAVNSEKRIKGKRSARPRQRAEPPTPEVEYVANCLVMLSSSGESWEQPRKQKKHADVPAKLDLKIRKRRRASPSNNNSSTGSGNVQSESVKPKKIRYECKTCKKMFQSFQALGGHRASHNKYKGCSAKQEEEEADNENLEEEIITSDEDLSKADDLSKSTPLKAPDSCYEGEKMKKCEVKTCSGGQIVDGYWVATSSSKQKKLSPWLDLNLPAPDEDSPKIWSSEKQVVFSDAESSDRDNLAAAT